MTIIVYHEETIYADDGIICHRPNDYVKTTGNKIFVSKCKRFAMAFCGLVPDIKVWEYIEGTFVHMLHDFYQSGNEQVPFKQEHHKFFPMIIDPMILMTAEHTWHLDGVSSIVRILTPIDNGVPVCMGSGTDVLLSYWALGFKVPEAMTKVNYFDSRCSTKITTLKRSSLKPFKYLEAKDAKPSGSNQRRNNPAPKGVPASKRVTRVRKSA